MLIIGTCYFPSRYAAESYFNAYASNSVALVKEKLRNGEIHLGKPPKLNQGEELLLIDNRTRYAILVK